MLYSNLVKRVVPFVLALAAGLLLAWPFVDLAPSFRVKGRMYRELKQENLDLKLQNEQLKQENQELKREFPNCKDADYKHWKLYREWEVPPPPEIKLDKRVKKELERLERGK